MMHVQVSKEPQTRVRTGEKLGQAPRESFEDNCELTRRVDLSHAEGLLFGELCFFRLVALSNEHPLRIRINME